MWQQYVEPDYINQQFESGEIPSESVPQNNWYNLIPLSDFQNVNQRILYFEEPHSCLIEVIWNNVSLGLYRLTFFGYLEVPVEEPATPVQETPTHTTYNYRMKKYPRRRRKNRTEPIIMPKRFIPPSPPAHHKSIRKGPMLPAIPPPPSYRQYQWLL